MHSSDSPRTAWRPTTNPNDKFRVCLSFHLTSLCLLVIPPAPYHPRFSSWRKTFTSLRKLGQMLHSHFTWIFNNVEHSVDVFVGVEGTLEVYMAMTVEKVFTIMLEIRASFGWNAFQRSPPLAFNESFSSDFHRVPNSLKQFWSGRSGIFSHFHFVCLHCELLCLTYSNLRRPHRSCKRAKHFS